MGDMAWMRGGSFRARHAAVRLLRRYAACRAGDAATLPAMVELAAEMNVAAHAAVALHSVLELTEACLGRPLQAECCCSTALSGDERAVLLLLSRGAAAGPARTVADIPRGLPGVLAWAVRAARLALGWSRVEAAGWSVEGCPFGGVTRAAG